MVTVANLFQRSRARALACVVLGALTLSACAVDKTGRRSIHEMFFGDFDQHMLVDWNQDIIAAFSGTYNDPELSPYVDQIGRRLVAESPYPDQDYAFFILSSPSIAAFALPDGNIYLTRGLLAHTSSEGEVAAVIAHMLGLIYSGATERHLGDALHQEPALLTHQGLVPDSELRLMTRFVTAPYLLPNTQEFNYEADSIAIDLLQEAGYDPMALLGLVDGLDVSARLEPLFHGDPGGIDPLHYHTLYPRDRNQLLLQLQDAADEEPDNSVSADRTLFLAQLDGIDIGEDPAIGFVEEGQYVTPNLGLTFQVPPAFRVAGGFERIFAVGPDRSGFVVDILESDRFPRNYVYLREVLARQLTLRNELRRVEPIKVNSMEGATADALLPTPTGGVMLRLVVIRLEPERMARMVFVMPEERASELDLDLRRVIFSLRKLLPQEQEIFRPRQLRVIQIQEGDTLEGLARHMPYRSYALERLLSLNGFPEGAMLAPGMQVKVVVP